MNYHKLSIFDTDCCLNVVIVFTLVMSSGSLFHSAEVCKKKKKKKKNFEVPYAVGFACICCRIY